jgi:hypothetical protein
MEYPCEGSDERPNSWGLRPDLSSAPVLDCFSMLTIRDPQLRALREAFWMSLILDHVRDRFPAECAKLGTSGVSTLITRAVKKGKGYGFRELADIQQYVDLVVVLGEDFESSSEFGWAREILEDKNPAAAKFRATWLYDNVTRHLAEKEQHARQN